MDFMYIVMLCIIYVGGTLTQSSNEDSAAITENGSSSSLSVLLLGAIHAGISIAAFMEMRSEPALNPHRIPHAVIPLHYNVYLASDPEHGMSWGQVHILVRAAIPTHSIMLHAKKLDFDEDTLVITDETTRLPIPVTSLQYEAQNEWYVIELVSPLHQDRHYTVSVAYQRQQALRNDGLAWTKYTSGNTSRWLVFTQFEPSGARNVFPCFDEPALKARFNMSIATPPGMHALSNMPLIDATEPVKELPGWVWSHFEESLPMSSYLVAFVITDFVQVRAKKPSKFSVWAPEEMKQQVQLVADLGPDILQALEEFTGIKYPLPKLDNILIPGFSSSYSGLENWGLITYRNNELSVDMERSTSMEIRSTLELVAHEVAHMWFGNLVTPVWWDYLWLKEGFADYSAHKAISKVLQDQHADEYFVTNNLQSTFRKDMGRISMNQKVSNLKEIERKYSMHAYEKGAVIVRMLENILTTNVFQTGVRQYLQEHSYQAAATKDLFRVLEDAAQNDPNVILPSQVGLAVVMDSWVSQGGFPLITVTRHYEKGSATVCQSVFASAFFTQKASSWWIPLSYTTQNEADFNNTAPRLWLPANQSCVTIFGLPGKDQWIIFNIRQTGYYRVHYDDHNWLLLANHLKSNQFQTIHAANRAQLLDDALNLMKFGSLSHEKFQNLTEYLHQETSPAPWLAILQEESICHRLKENSTLMEKVIALRGVTEDKMKREGTSHIWFRVVEAACEKACAPSSCTDNAYDVFKAFKDNPIKNRINPDLRYLILCNALSDEQATEEDLDLIWEMGRNATTKGEKYEIMLSLQNCPVNTALQLRFLTLLNYGEEWFKDQIPFMILAVQSLRCNRDSAYGVAQLLGILKARDPSLSPLITSPIEKLTTFISHISGDDGEAGEMWCEFLAALFAHGLGL